ncbi:trypsin-like serine protease [uncultured Nocardioides sp.]|mgnify:CR=1 FL=1|uniref:S1 family peptidase n=1 Tax=uncultured Nocardioides sp. TaxID=198441 RepID=UPI000C3905D4|nr:serine protease [uncultured Nocardioides sp.]MAO79181.1 trypsin [Nocardioides sp.]
MTPHPAVRRVLVRLLAPLLLLALAAASLPAPATAIVGGEDAKKGEFPFMASIQRAGSSGSDGQICGGSVVGKRWILTAAHCTVFSKKQVQVVVGRTDLTAKGGQVLRVSRFAVHPDYDDTGSSDVALWRTKKRIKAPRIALPKAADDALETAGTVLTVAGWGVESSGGSEAPENLKKVDVSVSSDLECITNLLLGFNADTEFCASELGGDSCQGDSGGPIFGNRENGKVVQVGVVSYGLGCAVPLFPGVYAELNAPSIIDWVRATMKAGKKAGR